MIAWESVGAAGSCEGFAGGARPPDFTTLDGKATSFSGLTAFVPCLADLGGVTFSCSSNEMKFAHPND